MSTSRSSDRAALIREIRANPDDPEPRMVFADWLSERGDPRGELIVIEHELASTYDAALERRRDALLDAHRERWLLPLEELGADEVELERGLVWSATLTGRAVANVGALCRTEPILHLTLNSGGRGPFSTAAEAVELLELRSLSLGGRYPAGMEAVLGSPHLGGLGDLSIWHLLTADAAAALANGPARPREFLARLEPTEAGTLAASQVMGRVDRLGWYGGDDALAALAKAPLAELRHLRAYDAGLGAGLGALGPRLDRLESIESSFLDAAGVRAMVKHMRSGRLRRLVTNVHDVKAQVRLLRSPVLLGVEVLDLPNTDLGKRAIAALKSSPYRGKLRSMWLSETRARFELPGVEIEWEGW
jgi:uncharacterized protein (TIGR02996 family)